MQVRGAAGLSNGPAGRHIKSYEDGSVVLLVRLFIRLAWTKATTLPPSPTGITPEHRMAVTLRLPGSIRNLSLFPALVLGAAGVSKLLNGSPSAPRRRVTKLVSLHPLRGQCLLRGVELAAKFQRAGLALNGIRWVAHNRLQVGGRLRRRFQGALQDSISSLALVTSRVPKALQ